MKQLISQWTGTTRTGLTTEAVTIQLNAYDHARIRALTELFPAHNSQQILTELISTALDEIEEAFPYIEGDEIIAEDEFGDPIYADVGITPRFMELTKKYASSMK